MASHRHTVTTSHLIAQATRLRWAPSVSTVPLVLAVGWTTVGLLEVGRVRGLAWGQGGALELVHQRNRGQRWVSRHHHR
eukprot:1859973-Amphidinium_carterae.2